MYKLANYWQLIDFDSHRNQRLHMLFIHFLDFIDDCGRGEF